MRGCKNPGLADAYKAEREKRGTQAEVADMLGVSTEKAQQLLDAARAMPRFEGKSAVEIAQMLDKDMNLRMQLEKNMGASEDVKTKTEMAKPAPPPMEPTPA